MASIEPGGRQQWTNLTDAQLLAQCEVDTYRASGPGGQKRNKTSSAVRLRHPPTGLLVIAEESRSQHENKAKALTRLRQAFYLQLREPIALGPDLAARPEVAAVKTASGKIDVGKRDARFWPLAGLLLDVLAASEARVADGASALGITTGNLIDTLQTHPKLWEHANQIRAHFGQKALK